MNEKTFVGVDCHKNTIACYCNERFKEFPTTTNGFKQALNWAPSNSNWAVEGSYHYGLTFSFFLLSNHCKVFEFNALRTAKARKLYSIAGVKTDEFDAKLISKLASDLDIKLQEVSISTIELKRKITKRELFVKQRTEIINNLKANFIQLGIKPPFRCFNTKKAVNWLLKQNDTNMKYSGKILKTLKELIEKLETEILDLTPKKALELTKIKGISNYRAAVIYCETKGKKMTKAQFASYCGVAPIPDESGQTERKRNNHRGNRKLNSILYSISICQSKYDVLGSEYYLRKLKEGKTKRHARKCLSRQISNQIWKILCKD